MRTVCDSEFQTVGVEDRKARLEKSVLMNGLSSSGMVAERKVRLQARSVDPLRGPRYPACLQSPHLLTKVIDEPAIIIIRSMNYGFFVYIEMSIFVRKLNRMC